MVFRISRQEAARHPGLRRQLAAARLPTEQRAAGGKGRAASRAEATAYLAWDTDREIGGARHWIIDLPDTELLNANVRRHWAQTQRLTAMIRQAAAVLARQQRIPPLAKARVVYVVKPRARTQVFDPSNWAPSAKAAVDGLQDAGVFEDDNAAVVTGVDPRAGERQNGMNIRMSLVIIDQGRKTERP